LSFYTARVISRRQGTAVPDGTVTAAFNAQPENVRIGARDSGDGRLNDWMGGERVYRVREEVVGLGQYGRPLPYSPARA